MPQVTREAVAQLTVDILSATYINFQEENAGMGESTTDMNRLSFY
jgi:hypothetical protein